MATLIEKLNAIKTAKNDIKDVIINEIDSETTATFAEYATVIDAKIKGLKKTVADLTEAGGTSAETIAALNQQITELTTAKETLELEKTELASNLNTANEQITGLQAEQTTIEQTLNDILDITE